MQHVLSYSTYQVFCGITRTHVPPCSKSWNIKRIESVFIEFNFQNQKSFSHELKIMVTHKKRIKNHGYVIFVWDDALHRTSSPCFLIYRAMRQDMLSEKTFIVWLGCAPVFAVCERLLGRGAPTANGPAWPRSDVRVPQPFSFYNKKRMLEFFFAIFSSQNRDFF